MNYMELGLLAVGVGLLVFGYRKNSRNLLVAAALMLLAFGVGPDLVAGFRDGLSGSTRNAPAG